MNTNLVPSKIIDGLGGTAATASLCEVSDQAVSQWRVNGIPKARLMYLKTIRPDVFMNAGDGGAEPTESREVA